MAKRRSNAVLVDHLQAIMTTADTYGGLEALEELLDEHQRARNLDPARAHQLEHLIREAIDRHHLADEIGASELNFNDLTVRCHEIISSVKNSQTRIGMHVLGEIPEGENRAETINTILRFDSDNPLNSRRLVFDLWGENIHDALKHPGERGNNGRTYGQILLDADRAAHGLIARLMAGETVTDALERLLGARPDGDLLTRFQRFADLVGEIDRRISASREIDVLLAAMTGGHVPAGPSGYLSRGRYDILPTGRNFYNVDPTRIPTRPPAGWGNAWPRLDGPPLKGSGPLSRNRGHGLAGLGHHARRRRADGADAASFGCPAPLEGRRSGGRFRDHPGGAAEPAAHRSQHPCLGHHPRLLSRFGQIYR